MTASPCFSTWIHRDRDHILEGVSIVPYQGYAVERRVLDAWMNTHVGAYAVAGKVDRAAFERDVRARVGSTRHRKLAAKIANVIEAFEGRQP